MKVTLHIGTEKTGTTSIQSALAVSRDSLAERGILYPRLFGSSNHMEIAVASRVSSDRDELQLIELSKFGSDDLNLYRERLQERIATEVKTGSPDRVVISNEHCHSRLVSRESVEMLATILRKISNDIEIVLYLRRQDRLAVSLNSTRIKLGGRGPLFPKVSDAGTTYYKYDALIDRYETVFPNSEIKIRIYERDMLKNGDVVEDFFDTVNLGRPPEKRVRENVSLSDKQSLFLQLFNERFPLMCRGKLNRERGPIFDAIRNVELGAPYKPPRKEAIDFYANFLSGNALVKSRFFTNMGRDTLFDSDFSEYPEAVVDRELTNDEMMNFIAAIWSYKK